jgi:endonuclease/exonuclease/phosphatase family metal-dependent hydrolase
MSKIKLVTYNLDHSSLREDIAANICKLAASGVGIFCLQEVRAKKSEEFIGDYILQKLGPGWEAKFFLSFDSKNDYGLGLIWDNNSFQAEEIHEISFPMLKRLPWFTAYIERHYLSGDPSPVKRGGLIATFRQGSAIFRVSNIHLDWHGKFPQRFRQLGFLLAHLNKSPVDTEIICGDFNTTGFFGNAWQIKKIQNLLGKDFINFIPEFTYTTDHHQHLDHIFARNIKSPSSEVLILAGSDHFPVLATFSLLESDRPEFAVSTSNAHKDGYNRKYGKSPN